MIPQELIHKARQLASDGPTKYQTPPQQLVDLSTTKALDLSERLGADSGIIEVGSLLMDCELGKATKEGKVGEHIERAVRTADKLLDQYPDIPAEVKNNIIACVAEHHGAEKFSTLESEICCNADCYKFASIDGFILALRFMRPMPIETQLKILSDKLEEKWSALTLKECIAELQPQYDLIKSLLASEVLTLK